MSRIDEASGKDEITLKLNSPITEEQWDAITYADCKKVEFVKRKTKKWIDGDVLMMRLADWWYSSFGEEETDEAKAIHAVMNQVEKIVKEMNGGEDG